MEERRMRGGEDMGGGRATGRERREREMWAVEAGEREDG